MSDDKVIPTLQKQRIIDYLKEGKRFDGRKLNEFRDIEVKMGLSKTAEASCSVKFGNTEVYAGVKMAITEPYPDSPNKGNFMCSAELSPLASNEFELGPPRINAIELGRVLDRGIRESGFIDFEKLCIKEGEKVWQVFLDISAINDDGNLMDVAGLAGLIALAHAKLPKYDAETFQLEHELSDTPLPLKKEAMAFNMTLHSINGNIIVDPTIGEEEISDWRLSVAIADNNGEPRITAMQKGKEIAISDEEMEKALTLIEDKFKDMFPKIKKIVFE